MAKTKGILLLAFGNRAYGIMAWNMLISIKHHNPALRVELAHDDTMPADKIADFDSARVIPERILYRDDQLSPCTVKCHTDELTDLDEWLYLDVDGIVLDDLEPFMKKLSRKKGPYFTQVNKSIPPGEDQAHIFWMKTPTMRESFELADDMIIHGLQSSWAYFKRTEDGKKFFDTVKRANDNRPADETLWHEWGGKTTGRDHWPDELIYSVACAKRRLDPTAPEIILFPKTRVTPQILKDYLILSLWGPLRMPHNSALKTYDNLMRQYQRARGAGHIYKYHNLARSKHAAGKLAQGYKKKR